MRFYAGYDPLRTPLWMSEMLYRCMPVLKAREELVYGTASVVPYLKDYSRREYFNSLNREAKFVLLPQPIVAPAPAVEDRDPEKARAWFAEQGIFVA